MHRNTTKTEKTDKIATVQFTIFLSLSGFNILETPVCSPLSLGSSKSCKGLFLTSSRLMQLPMSVSVLKSSEKKNHLLYTNEGFIL